VLAFARLDDSDGGAKLLEPSLIHLAGQLKGGKGLTMVASVLIGRYQDRWKQAAIGQKALKRSLAKASTEGFAQVRDAMYRPAPLQGLPYTPSRVAVSSADVLLSYHPLSSRSPNYGIKVVVGPDIVSTVTYLIQGAGLGALRHNTVILGWPHRWRTQESADVLLQAMSVSRAANLAFMVPK
jgi:hypothetical protein